MTEEQDWYFTFGFNQGHDNCYVKIRGTFESSRSAMIRRYGQKWAFQYPSAKAAGVTEYNLKELK